MPTQVISILIFSLALYGCDFRKSVHADLKTGLITKGDGLSCEEVWLSVDEKEIDRNTFVYGEMFLLHFNNMEGFKTENGNAFPGMFMWVTGESGDTVFKTEDLYSDYLNGINLSPLLLKANLTVGSPMHSNNNYKVFIKIWDKKDKGTFTAEMPFAIIENDKIRIEKNNISYDEIYLYSIDRDRAVIDGNVSFNETVYLIFEGLSGLTESGGNVFPGLKFQAIDNSNEIILDYEDLFSSYEQTGIGVPDFSTQIYVQMKFTQGQVANPIKCETIIFDKKSNSNIKITTDINVR
jgi:hypothetical protein